MWSDSTLQFRRSLQTLLRDELWSGKVSQAEVLVGCGAVRTKLLVWQGESGLGLVVSAMEWYGVVW